jgi:hypothetical protein
LKDILPETGKQVGKTQRQEHAGTQNAIAWGVVAGASNRDAPRGARAQKQTNLASDARQRGERERFRRSRRKPVAPLSKAIFSLDENQNMKQTDRPPNTNAKNT